MTNRTWNSLGGKFLQKYLMLVFNFSSFIMPKDIVGVHCELVPDLFGFIVLWL